MWETLKPQALVGLAAAIAAGIFAGRGSWWLFQQAQEQYPDLTTAAILVSGAVGISFALFKLYRRLSTRQVWVSLGSAMLVGVAVLLTATGIEELRQRQQQRAYEHFVQMYGATSKKLSPAELGTYNKYDEVLDKQQAPAAPSAP